MSSLQDHWRASLAALGLDPATGDARCRGLLDRYGDKGRHYHGVRHLEALVDWQHKYQAQLRDPALVGLAIWYHDAIYSTLRKDNEARSAALARKELSALGVPEPALAKIEALILQTANHHGPPLIKDPDLGWFLDFDLSILGAEPKTYARYAEAIRKEYRLVPDVLYRTGRSKVLRGMLQAEFLYYTPAFRQSHERQARKNLVDELKRWKAIDAMGLD